MRSSSRRSRRRTRPPGGAEPRLRGCRQGCIRSAALACHRRRARVPRRRPAGPRLAPVRTIRRAHMATGFGRIARKSPRRLRGTLPQPQLFESVCHVYTDIAPPVMMRIDAQYRLARRRPDHPGRAPARRPAAALVRKSPGPKVCWRRCSCQTEIPTKLQVCTPGPVAP